MQMREAVPSSWEKTEHRPVPGWVPCQTQSLVLRRLLRCTLTTKMGPRPPLCRATMFRKAPRHGHCGKRGLRRNLKPNPDE
jgi:hypothetical protein